MHSTPIPMPVDILRKLVDTIPPKQHVETIMGLMLALTAGGIQNINIQLSYIRDVCLDILEDERGKQEFCAACDLLQQLEDRVQAYASERN